MKKLLLVILVFFVLVSFGFAAEKTRTEKLIETVINHSDAVQMGPNWWRIVDKENISGTDFDWRFDLRQIDVSKKGLYIGHRLEQNSGNVPNSSWVIEYMYLDNLADGNLDYYSKDRFISIEQEGGIWLRSSPRWPDDFKYDDDLTKEQAFDLYIKELEWWENKLK